MPRAEAFVPPSPVSIPASAAGAAADTGTIAIGGAEIAGAVYAGVGAYNGTCWLLGVLTKTSDCQTGSSFLGIPLPHFGANGDDRSANYQGITRSGNNSAINGPDGHYLLIFPTIPSSTPNYSQITYRAGYTCANGVTHETQFVPNVARNLPNGFTPDPEEVDTTMSGRCGGPSVQPIAYQKVGSIIAPALVRAYWIDFGMCSGSPCGSGATEANVTSWTRFQTYITDAAQPWTLTYTVHCINADGQTATITATTHFTPTGNADAPNPGITDTCWGKIPDGHVKDVQIQGGRDSVSNPEVNVIYPTYNAPAINNYPLCTTKAPPGGCWLDLQKNGKSCFATGVYCAGWMSNETRWNMTCEWGPYSMPMSDCEAAYGTKFDVETQPDPNPTSTASGGPTVSAAPLPTTGPNPSTPPSAPYDPNPTPTGDPGPDPNPNPPTGNPESSDCWGNGWSWNPVSWVYIPIKCALSWAFIPRNAPGFGDIPNPLPPGWVPSFPSLSDGSCGPITIPSLDFGPLLPASGTHQLVNTCDAPWPLARNLTYYGLLAGVLIPMGHRGFRAVMTALGMGVDTGDEAGGDDE
jgi:hypothetical protein